MAVPLRQEPVESAADIIATLSKARTLPREALRLAVERADEIAPAVIEVVEAAARGVFLMPEQESLLLWGIHAVAAAGRTELHRPLLRLVQQTSPYDLERLLGDAATETLAKLVISSFDGNPEPLLAACVDKRIDELVRWNLIVAMARLTFDGRLPRATMLAFLDRFEREDPADPGSVAWKGWQDAIVLLGVEDMRDRLRATWTDDRNPPDGDDIDDVERRLTMAQALAPGDAALFVEEGITALDDPVRALEWTEGLRPDSGPADPMDPAVVFALKDFEAGWLRDFIDSPKVPVLAMTMEEVDGFFCALIAGPVGASFDASLVKIWNPGDGGDAAPSYDSAEQEQFVRALLKRHWTAIGLRLDATSRHVPLIPKYREETARRSWATGFLRGMATRKTEWHLRMDEDVVAAVTGMALSLRRGESDDRLKGVLQMRHEEMVMALPNALIALHHTWRGREDPFARISAAALDRKIGRNESCPCRSGKKYKHCCGSAGRRPLD